MSDPHHDLGRDVGIAVAKVAPPFIAWLSPNAILVWLSIVYVLLQMAFLLWKWSFDARKRREGL